VLDVNRQEKVADARELRLAARIGIGQAQQSVLLGLLNCQLHRVVGCDQDVGNDFGVIEWDTHRCFNGNAPVLFFCRRA
jgi:hypothetical protein